MSPLDQKLQTSPEIFKTVNMATIPRILARSVINRSVPVSSFGKPEVGTKFISMNSASLTHIPAIQKSKFFNILSDFGYNNVCNKWLVIGIIS